jgi:nitroimidazol reductase NimA-like FMN-containing flavoprotein (pyridoxamine 5'-phosphate oxidase superfamily)
MPINVGSSTRTELRRVPKKEVLDTKAVKSILDESLFGNLACIVDGQPFIMPVGFARHEDEIFIHGSSASRLLKVLAKGQPTCFSTTILDGMVVARSAMNSSMNYRSVMALGICRELEGEEKLRALDLITERLLPGRTKDARPTSPQEDKATIVLALDLSECSCKIGSKYPEDDPEDLVDNVYGEIWAGIIPIQQVYGKPIPDPQTLKKRIPLPEYFK